VTGFIIRFVLGRKCSAFAFAGVLDVIPVLTQNRNETNSIYHWLYNVTFLDDQLDPLLKKCSVSGEEVAKGELLA